MANPQKRKGSAFERVIADEMSAEFGLSIIRTPNSGAYVGGKNACRIETLTEEQVLLADGDLVMPKELAHIKVECKAYKDFSFVSLFENNALMDKWIEQSLEGTDKHWFVIFKINRQGVFVAFDKDLKETYMLPRSYFTYKSSIICKYKGFFQQNKDIILNLR